MEVAVLGSGCANCHRLESSVNEALEQMGRPERAALVTDIMEISRLGVMTTPALAIDDRVVFAGKIPGVPELISLFSGHQPDPGAPPTPRD